jgi:M6 family metalloprotease-like protein
VVSWSLVAGPATLAAAGAAPCALPRTGVAHSEGVTGPDRSFPRPTAARPVDAVLVFLDFPGSRPELTPHQVAADHFPGTSRFWARASYGAFRLRPHPLRRWLRMPYPATHYSIRRDWAPADRDAYLRDAFAVADRAVDFARYRLVYLIADPDAPGVDSDATKVVNLGTPIHLDGTAISHVATVFEAHPPDRDVLAHETGHLIDLPDLYRSPTSAEANRDGGADWDSRTGDWDVMGSQFALAPDPFGWEKWRLGWISGYSPHGTRRAPAVRCLTRRGTARVALEPLEERRPYGTVLAVLRTGPDAALALEARTAQGNDASTCTEGVLVYRVRSDVPSGAGPVRVIDTRPGSSACDTTSVHPALADAPLASGQSWTSPDGRTTVRVGRRTARGGWHVTVTAG